MSTELFAKYTCTNCQEDISGIRVHCVVCTDFELCLAVGVDAKSKKMMGIEKEEEKWEKESEKIASGLALIASVLFTVFRCRSRNRTASQ